MILAEFTVIQEATEIAGNGCNAVFDEDMVDILSIGFDSPKEMIANGI